MIKIPGTNKRFIQENKSDMVGNVYYTKNINFDETGYIKLADRTVSIKSEEGDSNFNMPLAFGRTNDGFMVATTDQAYDVNFINTSFAVTEDTGTNNPNGTLDSHGRWFQNRWHVTTDTAMFYKTGIGANWTNSAITLSSGKTHAMEAFRSRNTFCVADGNSIQQLDTSYVATINLTLPSDMEVIGLSYSRAQMGIICKLADTVSYQNQESYFYVWDGAATSANNGYSTGADMVVAVTAYKSSWVVLTRTGELKYFNGGGWDILGALPFYYNLIGWGDSVNRPVSGDTLVVDGDVIYINVGNKLNRFGNKNEVYIENYPTGILCYDPAVGIYHRYSHSISTVSSITVTSGNIDTATDILTKTAGTLSETGTPIKYIGTVGTPIGGLAVFKVYYIIKHSATTFSLATTRANALLGTKIDLTSTGAANNYFLSMALVDYGTSNALRTGGIGLVDRSLSVVGNSLIFGGELYDNNSTSDYDTMCITVDGFKNIGYVVTGKAQSSSVEDLMQKVFIKFRPLDTEDSIIVKYKDIEVIGLPVTTPQYTTNCSWTSTTTFTTTADLSEADAFLDAATTNELECEIIDGAGAGQMAKITSIAYAGGTYTVTLADELEGAASGSYCDVKIDNWKVLATITSTNTKGWEEIPIATTSKWIKLKVELRGVATTIEELQLINKAQQLSL